MNLCKFQQKLSFLIIFFNEIETFMQTLKELLATLCFINLYILASRFHKPLKLQTFISIRSNYESFKYQKLIHQVVKICKFEFLARSQFLSEFIKFNYMSKIQIVLFTYILTVYYYTPKCGPYQIKNSWDICFNKKSLIFYLKRYFGLNVKNQIFSN